VNARTSKRIPPDPERVRLVENGDERWWRWGPYLAERQWGTVREDYSADGDAWNALPHEHARSRAYRWGEDGLGGFSDREQRLCLSVALWNGRDPILKERLFGLTNGEGNHGEDVKEAYWYLDATPTHACLKMLYRYPLAAFPYARLVEENARRGPDADELEIVDTGVFDEGRYVDVAIAYAKAGPDDVLMRVTLENRGPETARIHVLPQLVFRNTWSWEADAPKPALSRAGADEVLASHAELGDLRIRSSGHPRLLFADNETNVRRLYGVDGGPAHPKDAFHAFVVEGREDAVHPEAGTKAAFLHVLEIPAGQARSITLRLAPELADTALDEADAIFEARRGEAEAFYAGLHPEGADGEVRRVQRQAWAGLIWTKQTYRYDVRRWLEGDPGQPPPPPGRARNAAWRHLSAREVLSMPDTWEYPWFAAWDVAFHAIPLARLDPPFAKHPLDLLTREWMMHPNGQIPAYEWAFGDVNPPVHAWATWRVFEIDREARGDAGDLAFLERVFHKLLLNFTWWVNRKDPEGRNVFEGGFLGLDNIGVFDRSAPLPTGGHLHQSDGTSWMAMYSLDMLRIALELALHNPVYEDIATKFFEHFLEIAAAMTHVGGDGIGLWDERDEFYYDVLHLPDGTHRRLRVRSMVGLIPLAAVAVLEPVCMERLPGFARRLEWTLANRPNLAALVSRWAEPGIGDRRLLSLLRGHRMKRLLARMLDGEEFLSPYGVRALSRRHRDEPYELECDGSVHTVRYEPGESRSGLFGGNSNWRGPVWFPVNYLLIESLLRFHAYYGDEFRIECPTGTGTSTTIRGVAEELARRLVALFLPDAEGRRPVYGRDERLQSDPRFRDHLWFFEYFDGDTGRGLGAAHQTGWTALVAELVHAFPSIARRH